MTAPRPTTTALLLATVVLALLPAAFISLLQAGEPPVCRRIVPPIVREKGSCGGTHLRLRGNKRQQLHDPPCEGCVHYLIDPLGWRVDQWRLEIEFEDLNPRCRYEVLYGREFRAGPSGILVDAQPVEQAPEARCAANAVGLSCTFLATSFRMRGIFLVGVLDGGPPELAAGGVFFSTWQTYSLGFRGIDLVHIFLLCLAAVVACAHQLARAHSAPVREGIVGATVGMFLLWARPEAFGGRSGIPSETLAAGLVTLWLTTASLPVLQSAYRRGRALALLATGTAGALGILLGYYIRQLAPSPTLLSQRQDLLLHAYGSVMACICIGLVVLVPGVHEHRVREWLIRHLPRLSRDGVISAVSMSIALLTLPVVLLWGMARFGNCSIYFYSGIHQPSGLCLSFLLLSPTLVGLSRVATSRPAVGASTEWMELPFLLVEVRSSQRALRGRIRMRRVGDHQGYRVLVRHNSAPAPQWLAEDTESVLIGLKNAYGVVEQSESLEVSFEYDGEGDFYGRSYRLPLALLYLQSLAMVSSAPILATGNLDLHSGRVTDVERVTDKLAALRPGEVLLCPPQSLPSSHSDVHFFRSADLLPMRELARMASESCIARERVAVEVATLDMAVDFLSNFYSTPRG